MQTIFDQWQEGLLSGEEALCKLLGDAGEVALSMKRALGYKTWYHLEQWQEDRWVNVANGKWKPILLRRNDAANINECCKAGYCWHPTIPLGD